MAGATRSGHSSTLAVFRSYVTNFVNRHDFSVLPTIMQPDYTLDTTGIEISGRDGPYSAAVRQQMDQFPGLLFTVHELFVSGTSIGVRFTEHGASIKHEGTPAAWPSIAIYDVRDGLLARCTIEQDYVLRRRQLAGTAPVQVPSPAVAPWDEADGEPCPAEEALVRAWLESGAWLSAGSVIVDDSDLTGGVETIIQQEALVVDRMISARNRLGAVRVAFHAVQSGFAVSDQAGTSAGQAAHIHLSGLVTVAADHSISGHIIRDRLGLQRRLTPRPPRQS